MKVLPECLSGERWRGQGGVYSLDWMEEHEEESIKVQGKWLLCSEQKKTKTSEILVFDENNLCVCVCV